MSITEMAVRGLCALGATVIYMMTSFSLGFLLFRLQLIVQGLRDVKRTHEKEEPT
jgi:hypothetical protein